MLRAVIRVLLIQAVIAGCAGAQDEPPRLPPPVEPSFPKLVPPVAAARLSQDAQADENDAEQSGPTPKSVLARAYDISRDLPPDTRAGVLSLLVPAAGQLMVKQGKQWADELFALADDLPPGSVQQRTAQSSAIVAVARFDVNHAAELLAKMPAAPAEQATPGMDRRSMAARTIFQEMLSQRGMAALDDIRQQARQLGETGQYPYAALVPILFRRNMEDENAETLRSLFAEALDYYRRSSVTVSNENEFTVFLRAAADRVPPDLARDAAQEIASHLVRVADLARNDSMTYRANTTQGLIDYGNPAQPLARDMLDLLRTLDARLADSLASKVPSLDQPAPGFDYGLYVPQPGSGPAGGQSTGLPNQARRAATMSRVQSLARRDPKAALAVAQNISDPQIRASALASLASRFGGDSQQSRSIFEQAEKAADAIDSASGKVAAYQSVAVAASGVGDSVTARDVVQRGFAMLDSVIRQQDDVHPERRQANARTGYGFSGLARVGARFIPEYTLAAIENLSDPEVRAYLLIAAAQGLRPPGRRTSVMGPPDRPASQERRTGSRQRPAPPPQ